MEDIKIEDTQDVKIEGNTCSDGIDLFSVGAVSDLTINTYDLGSKSSEWLALHVDGGLEVDGVTFKSVLDRLDKLENTPWKRFIRLFRRNK